MKKIISLSLTLVLVFTPLQRAEASIFGEENATLIQILVQAIKQLAELQRIVQQGKDTLNLLDDVNRGMNDALRLLDSVAPFVDAGTYQELKKIENIIKHFKGAYGVITPSLNEKSQSDTDQVVAEAINLNNSLYDYTKELDSIGEKIKSFSSEASPAVAQKLTAQALGVVVHVMNQQIRAQATGLKIQAQSLALQNKKEKESTTEFLKQAELLGGAMKNKKTELNFPRF